MLLTPRLPTVCFLHLYLFYGLLFFEEKKFPAQVLPLIGAHQRAEFSFQESPSDQPGEACTFLTVILLYENIICVLICLTTLPSAIY